MKLSFVLLVLVGLALLMEVESQRRQGGRNRASGTSRSSRRRTGRQRSPGGREKVMAVRAARTRAESDPNWIKCLNSVEEVPRAQHVITGRVEHVSAKGAIVRIKRILKGSTLPKTVFIDSCDGMCCTLRKKDTRIFLLGRPREVIDSEGGARGVGSLSRTWDGRPLPRGREDLYPLVATPLRIRLKSLAMIRSAIKDVPYEHTPPLQEEPCEQQYCAWGGECQMDDDGVPFCTCPTSCSAPSATTSPVCGTDGKTYDTICQLRRHSCSTNQTIRISHTGYCDVLSSTGGESSYRDRSRSEGFIRDEPEREEKQEEEEDGDNSHHRNFLLV